MRKILVETTRVVSVLTALAAILVSASCRKQPDENGTFPPGKILGQAPWKKPNQAVVIVLVKPDNTFAFIPDTAYLWNGEAKERDVVWAYFNEELSIAFKESLMPKVTCTPSGYGTGGTCTATIPKGAKGSYPYTVNGKANGKPVTQADPDIEVDR